ncbi:MAG: radical SAM family heme chaperone HemW [Holosporales bacterium]|jgi:oxygen-independent coproporphyrinogen-3 oxidase|nr:radical SAM family heme chaperone HemW [Holosporales bacterium]
MAPTKAYSKKHVSKDYFALYIHWPFCMSKCPYCSFNSYPITDLIDFEAWKYAYRFCLEKSAQQTRDRKITSVYFGGGTPSLLPAAFLGDLINDLHKLWPIADDCEISIEMNPGNVTESHIANIYSAGINRVSIGIQSLRTDGLTILGRKHSVDDALRTADFCSRFFKNYSVDLIYAWPTHDLEQWKKELAIAFTLGAPHMSFYQLVVESDSVFGDMYSRGELILPDDNTCASMFEYLQYAACEAGLSAYEISNHARPGFECRHNISYWEYSDYIGIGPGAHGRLTINNQKHSIVHELNPQKWLNSIMDRQHILEEMTMLSLDEQMKEALLVGMRMTKGIFCDDLPMPFESIVNAKAFDRLLKEKYLTNKDGVVAATLKGRKRLNALMSYLIDS